MFHYKEQKGPIFVNFGNNILDITEIVHCKRDYNDIPSIPVELTNIIMKNGSVILLSMPFEEFWQTLKDSISNEN